MAHFSRFPKNFLIDQTSVIQIQPLFQARWIIEIMRSVKSKKTYKKWFTALIKIVTPNEPWNPESTEFVWDTYHWVSSKSCTHKERGESGKRAYLKSEHKNMMSGKEWAAFFHNIENKQVLCNLFANFIRN